MLAEKLKQQEKQQQQPSHRLRTNTRLCRETAINNNNEGIATATTTTAARQLDQDNGNSKYNN